MNGRIAGIVTAVCISLSPSLTSGGDIPYFPSEGEVRESQSNYCKMARQYVSEILHEAYQLVKLGEAHLEAFLMWHKQGMPEKAWESLGQAEALDAKIQALIGEIKQDFKDRNTCLLGLPNTDLAHYRAALMFSSKPSNYRYMWRISNEFFDTINAQKKNP